MTKNLLFKFGANDVASQIRRDIYSGVLLQFDRFPPERALSSKLGVSRGTIRAAIRKLEAEGLIKN